MQYFINLMVKMRVLEWAYFCVTMKKYILSLIALVVVGSATAQADSVALRKIGKSITLTSIKSNYNACDCYVMDTTFFIGQDSASKTRKAKVKRGGALRGYSQDSSRGKHISAGADKGWDVVGNKITLKQPCYYLPGVVHIDSGVILNIPAGTTFYGSKLTFSAFVQLPGSQVFAIGTAAAPVRFTSAMKSRSRGDWGGIVIAGKAPIAGEVSSSATGSKTGNYSFIEGLDNKKPYKVGGSKENDNSGAWSYVQCDYAGLNVGATGSGNELNSFSLYGVGSATKMNNLQVTWANDDAIEIFGGSVNVQNIFILNTLDDDIDLDGGYQGTIQNALVYRLDTASRDVSRSRLAEISNKNINHPRRTMPVISNVTAFGARAIVGKTYVFKGASSNERSMTGFSIDKNASARIYNSILHGYDQALYIDDQNTANNLDSAWGPQFAYNIWNGCVADMTVGSSVTYFSASNAFPKDNKDNWLRYFQASNLKTKTDAMKNIGYNVTVGQATYPALTTLGIYSTYAKDYGNLAAALIKYGSGFGSNDTLDSKVTLKAMLTYTNRGVATSKLTGFTTDATTDKCGLTPKSDDETSNGDNHYKNLEVTGIQLFAINPSQGEINVEIQDAKTNQLSDVRVYDLSGKLVKSLTASGSKINVSNMSVGLYTVVVNVSGLQQSIKVVVE